MSWPEAFVLSVLIFAIMIVCVAAISTFGEDR